MQRKVFSAEFKAKVVMEALTGRKTINEIAGTHEAHPNQVTHWERKAQERLEALFERKRGRRSLDDDRDADAAVQPDGSVASGVVENQVWSTDITDFHWPGGFVYLVAIRTGIAARSWPGGFRTPWKPAFAWTVWKTPWWPANR